MIFNDVVLFYFEYKYNGLSFIKIFLFIYFYYIINIIKWIFMIDDNSKR